MANPDFSIAIQSAGDDASQPWTQIPSYAVEVANANIASNDFHRHTVALASFDFTGHVKVKVTYGKPPVKSAVIRPLSLSIETELENNQITFTLDKARDIMLE